MTGMWGISSRALKSHLIDKIMGGVAKMSAARLKGRPEDKM